MNSNKRFWSVIGVLLFFIVSNLYISLTAVKQNHLRITNLEAEKNLNEVYIRSTLEKIEASSRETAEKVVEALTGLTKVIAERSQNDQRVLELLEAIQAALLKGEKNG